MSNFQEYEHQVVPETARRSTWSLAAVWTGYPLVLTPGIVGGLLVLAMGFKPALLAILIGNCIQLLYVGTLGMLGQQRGMSFALQSSVTYGRYGFMIMSAILSTTLLGWVGVQIGLTGDFMTHSFPVSYYLMTVIAGISVLILTYNGIKCLQFISLISTPLFILAGIYIIVDICISHGWGTVWHFSAPPHKVAMPLGIGISTTIATFIDGGTVNADYCRWAKNKVGAWIATAAGFPCSNFLSMMIGGIIIAAISQPGSKLFSDGNMFSYIVNKHYLWLTIIAIIFLFSNMGSVNSHTLYNSVAGWSHIAKKRFRFITVILGIIATIIALTGVWHYMEHWLSLLGIIIPPIGGVIISDQLFVRRQAQIDRNWNWRALLAAIIGMVIASLINWLIPDWITAIWGIVFAMLSYWLLNLSSVWKNNNP